MAPPVHVIRLTAALPLVTVLAACTDGDGPMASPAPTGTTPTGDPVASPASSVLAGTSWYLESYATTEGSVVPGVRETPYLLVFGEPGGALADFRMTLADGCGDLEGDYRSADGELVTVDVGNTDDVVSCDERPVGDPLADAFLTDLFTNARLAFEIEGVVLTLSKDSGESARFVERGASIASALEERLVGPRWMLSRRATDAGETLPVAADDRSSYTVRFSVSTDGAGIVRRSLGGTNVCNGYGGDYALVDGTLLLNGVDEDAAFCEDAGSPVASAFSRVLFDTASPPMVAFEGDDLVLRSGANESLGFTDGLVAGETALNRVFDVRWRLSSFTTGTGESVVQAVPEPATVFELVSGTGIVNGTPGCIDRFGYAVEGATLTFVEIPGTGPGCDGALGEDAEAYARQIEFVQRAFLGGLGIAFDDERLELRGGSGAMLAFSPVRTDQASSPIR